MSQQVLDRLQRPIRDLRISVTDRCNFRCTYCMPAEIFGERYEFLPRSDLLTFEEIARLTRLYVSLGATKVRLTGGEPLLRRDLERLIEMLAAIDGVEDLTLTTNAFLLAQQAQALKDAGLKRVTVSLDSLDAETFGKMNGRGYAPDRVLEGIEAAELVGLSPIKINVVVQKGVNDHTIVDMARFFKGTGRILRFIEFMDVGNLNGWNLEQVMPSQDVVARISAEMPLERVPPSYPGEVAERFRYTDGSGEIGVISSVTQPFCGDCTRVRLSPDGKVFTCLFASVGIDLRELLRDGASDEQILARMTGNWRLRGDRYSEARASMTDANERKIEMYQIGG